MSFASHEPIPIGILAAEYKEIHKKLEGNATTPTALLALPPVAPPPTISIGDAIECEELAPCPLGYVDGAQKKKKPNGGSGWELRGNGVRFGG